jgi:hypothetical protein
MPGEAPAVFTNPLMNGYVGGFHLMVRTHINCRRYFRINPLGVIDASELINRASTLLTTPYWK